MGTTADKLNKLLSTKALIKQALIDKGIDIDDSTPFSLYAEKIYLFDDYMADNTEYLYDVFILAGQSNMVGWGTPFDEENDVFDALVFQLKQDGSIAEAQYNLDHIPTNTNPNGTCTGMQHIFTNQYIADGLNNGRKILLVPCAASGTSFQSGAWTGANQTKLLTQINKIKEFNNCDFKGVLWHQGESDIIEGNTAENWKSQLKELIKTVRTAVGKEIPFIMGEWSRSWYESKYLVKAQDFFLKMEELASEINECDIVTSEDLSGDAVNTNIHFSAASQRKLGQRYYNSYKSMTSATSKTIQDLSLNYNKLTINQGRTMKLLPIFTPYYTTNKNITWTSDNIGVAKVVNGVVEGVSGGVATIKATSSVNGSITSTCQITVNSVDEENLLLDTDKVRRDTYNSEATWESTTDVHLKSTNAWGALNFFFYDIDFTKQINIEFDIEYIDGVNPLNNYKIETRYNDNNYINSGGKLNGQSTTSFNSATHTLYQLYNKANSELFNNGMKIGITIGSAGNECRLKNIKIWLSDITIS